MTWEPMTIDEYAAFQRSSGAKVVKIRDTWWTEARPFFFRPLFPFAEINPQFNKYPIQSLLGGILHLVPSGVFSNSYMNLLLYDELKYYSTDKLSAKQRWILKKGLDNFCAMRITDLNQFVEEACTIYKSFYDRTSYFYKKERTNKEHFAAWAKPFFEYPKIVVMGAYHQDKLSAIDISYRVEDIIIDDIFFSDSQSQPLKVTDFLVHTLRETAKSTDARLLFRGFPTGKQTLDESKVTRGCKILKMPAYCKINPLALYVGKAFMNESYKKLIAITSFYDMKADKSQLTEAQ
jgi:uncharacterized protein YcgL (UPF0745 family)